MEGFVGEKEYFKVGTLLDWEPVKYLKVRGHVVAGAGVSQDASS